MTIRGWLVAQIAQFCDYWSSGLELLKIVPVTTHIFCTRQLQRRNIVSAANYADVRGFLNQFVKISDIVPVGYIRGKIVLIKKGLNIFFTTEIAESTEKLPL